MPGDPTEKPPAEPRSPLRCVTLKHGRMRHVKTTRNTEDGDRDGREEGHTGSRRLPGTSPS